MQEFTLQQLTQSIQKILAAGILTSTSLSVSANNEEPAQNIWLNYGVVNNICVHDFDLDGDLDVFNFYKDVVTRLENQGTLEFPKFSSQTIIMDYPNALTPINLGLSQCSAYTRSNQAFVDIDGDGDLDKFSYSSSKGGVIDQNNPNFIFSKNEGTNEQPIYHEQDAKDLGLPIIVVDRVLFADMEGDGDLDFFGWSIYENKGTVENASFVELEPSPVELFCHSRIGNHFLGQGVIVDLNDDGLLDRLCDNGSGQLEYTESSTGGYLPAQDINQQQYVGRINSVQLFDIDEDGDLDVLSHMTDYAVLYSNISTGLLPQYDTGRVYTELPAESRIVSFADLDGDNDLDYLFGESSQPSSLTSQRLQLAINTGSALNPKYTIDSAPAMLAQCQSGLDNIISAALTDIDSDGDLDLFIRTVGKSRAIIYCENIGTSHQPEFSAAVVEPFGLVSVSTGGNYANIFVFEDRDGDGDQDMRYQSSFYENKGDAATPLFSLSSERPHYDNDTIYSASIDTDNDGILDSVFLSSDGGKGGLRLAHKMELPTKDMDLVSLSGENLRVTQYDSLIRLQYCGISEGRHCYSYFSEGLQEVDVISGSYNTATLAIVDKEGYINLKVLDNELNLIREEKGGKGHSISLASPRNWSLNSNEKSVIAFVDENNKVTAVVFNQKGDIISARQLGEGKMPDVSYGQVSNREDFIVASYLTLDNQLKITTFLEDGTVIADIDGGSAIDAKVSRANFLDTIEDDYVASIVRPDGKIGLLGFSHKGELLGEITGGIAQQPMVIWGRFFSREEGLAVSVIQADKKPAVIFLDKQGNYVATGVGERAATKVAIKEDNRSNAILTYIDEEGLVREEVFSSDGARI